MNGKDVLRFVREDDFVEYFLFPIETYSDDERSVKLKNLLDNVNKLVKEYSADYIWHRDSFSLSFKTESMVLDDDNQSEILPPHLYGVTHYGDNIEDEWFIVYLLRQITKEIDGLAARVIDNDGEFLLIEAADSLPAWADPEMCEKRVFLYRGSLHLIAPDPKIKEITIQKSLETIKNQFSFTVAPQNIQNCIDRRTGYYPQKFKDNIHRRNVYLPIGVAALLNENPNLISAAVTSFCNRDSIDSKYCRAMKYFPPEVRVRSNVTFTRCLYAMLVNSKYQPDRKTGWNLPPVNNRGYNEQLLGVKLACGFEILASQAKPGHIENDKGFIKYLEKLKEKGYFKGLLENSKEYNKLLDDAKGHYKKFDLSNNHTNSKGKQILDTLKQLEYNYNTFKEQESNLPENDDESWLNISPEELDKFLEDQYGSPLAFKLNSNTNPTLLTETLDTFLNRVSDVEGAEFPTPPPRSKKSNKVSFSDPSESNSKVNFDPSSFACAVQDILNFVIPEDDAWESSSDSDMSAYGKEEKVSDEMNEMRRLMDEMDKELAGTTIGESFKSKTEGFEDIESFKPVDVDVNALKNILESYRSQLGEAGPSSNMLGPMGVRLDEVD